MNIPTLIAFAVLAVLLVVGKQHRLPVAIAAMCGVLLAVGIPAVAAVAVMIGA